MPKFFNKIEELLPGKGNGPPLSIFFTLANQVDEGIEGNLFGLTSKPNALASIQSFEERLIKLGNPSVNEKIALMTLLQEMKTDFEKEFKEQIPPLDTPSEKKPRP